MVLARRNWSPIEPKVEARSSMLPIQSAHPNKSVVSGRAKPKAWRRNLGIRAQVCLFQILAIFGVMMCENAVRVHGLARAGEERNFLHIGRGEGPSDGVVLQGSPYTMILERPRVSSLRLSKYELEEVLSVKLKLLRSKASAFLVFINLPNANEQTPITCPEFSGSYFHMPSRVKSPDYEYQETLFRIGISDVIKDLGLTEQPSILVTFVPCGADKGLPIVLERVQIELD